MNPDKKKFKYIGKDRSFPFPAQLMEVCGTHTVAIHRQGIQHLLPENVRLVSGPGCPVCVTPGKFIDEAVYIARQGMILTTFGDMMRVPGTESSLQKERARGSDIRIVYSPLESLEICKKTKKEVVFLAVGFETTIPAVAVTLLEASRQKPGNFFVHVCHRLIPPALDALLSSTTSLNGFLLPGHVSTIIGLDAYQSLKRASIPGVISGFEGKEILSSLDLLLEMIESLTPDIINNYGHVVRDEGNPKSREIISRVFEEEDAAWRGLGVIPKSGLSLRSEFSPFSIHSLLNIPDAAAESPEECRCGDVLRGLIQPTECPRFRVSCNPENPKGPCMVSMEGSCHAWYLYG